MSLFKNIIYEIWDLNRLYIYLNQSKLKFSNDKKNVIDGFTFFNKNLIYDIQNYNKEKYILNNLSKFEIQSDYNSNPSYYARFIVALSNKKVVGILALQWIKDDLPFWRYHEKWIDVHIDYRMQGIAKRIYQILDNVIFLKEHILQWSVFSELGQKCSKGIPGYYLTVKEYIFIPSDYSLLKAPIEYGRYDSYGRKIN